MGSNLNAHKPPHLAKINRDRQALLFRKLILVVLYIILKKFKTSRTAKFRIHIKQIYPHSLLFAVTSLTKREPQHTQRQATQRMTMRTRNI